MIERRLQRVRQTNDLSVKQLSLSELHRELQRRIANLQERRDALLEELEEINDELAAMEVTVAPAGTSSSGGKRRRGRASNAVPLHDLIIQMLQEGPRAKRELVEGALARGYKTNSKDFSANVGSVLSGNDEFESRGGKWHYVGPEVAEITASADEEPAEETPATF